MTKDRKPIYEVYANGGEVPVERFSDRLFARFVFERPVLDARQRLIDFYTHDRNGGGQIRGVLIKDTEVDRRWPRASTIMALCGGFDGIHFDNFIIAGKVCESLGEADVIVENYPNWDVRKPNVRNVTFSPGGRCKWHPARPEPRAVP